MAAAAFVICVCRAGMRSGVYFADVRRVPSTILGVKILRHFLMWWAAQ